MKYNIIIAILICVILFILYKYIQEIYKLKNTQNMEITHDKTRHMFEFTENGNSAVVEYKSFDGGDQHFTHIRSQTFAE